jgi:alcohol dehydrogenase class IV
VAERHSALETAEAGIEFLVRLSADCGVPQRLSELGISRDRIPTLARAAMQVRRLLKNNPRDVSETDAVAIYQAAF